MTFEYLKSVETIFPGQVRFEATNKETGLVLDMSSAFLHLIWGRVIKFLLAGTSPSLFSSEVIVQCERSKWYKKTTFTSQYPFTSIFSQIFYCHIYFLFDIL